MSNLTSLRSILPKAGKEVTTQWADILSFYSSKQHSDNVVKNTATSNNVQKQHSNRRDIPAGRVVSSYLPQGISTRAHWDVNLSKCPGLGNITFAELSSKFLVNSWYKVHRTVL